MYIEPLHCIAFLDDRGFVDVRTSVQLVAILASGQHYFCINIGMYLLINCTLFLLLNQACLAQNSSLVMM